MRIKLDLTSHCIETEIKRRHEAAISRYFNGVKDRDAVEAELVLLEKALTAFDFARLRSRWPDLAGGESPPVFLIDGDNGHPCLQFANHRILAPADEV